jgi:DNA-directed RNA polymerase subunit beta'
MGLKENVIMGRLIPAGTGVARYGKIGIQIDAPADVLAEAGEIQDLTVRPPSEPERAGSDAEGAVGAPEGAAV